MKYSSAHAQHHRGINCSGTANHMYLPSPRKFILLLAKLHAETQVAAKIPNGKEKPQCRFVYLFTNICTHGDKRCSPLWQLPLPHAPLLPTASLRAQGKGGPGGAGGPGSQSVLAARCGTPATWPSALRHQHRSTTAAFAGLTQKEKPREAGRRLFF